MKCEEAKVGGWGGGRYGVNASEIQKSKNRT